MKETYFSKMHPAVSFGFFIAALVFTMVVMHPAYLAASLFCAFCLNLSLKGKKAVRSLLMLIPLWIFVSGINPLFNTMGSHVLFQCFGRPYTMEALIYGMVLAGMLVAMMQWFSAYNVIMTEDKFSYLFGTMAPSAALLLTTVLRMIPNLARRAKQIAGARRCIGKGGAENASVKEKLTDGMTTISVLTSLALEESVVTADSMNSRGYGAGKRSCYHSYRFAGADLAAVLVFAALCGVSIAALVKGSGSANYTPDLVIAPMEGWGIPGIAAYTFFLLIPTILNIKEEIQWHISRSKI